MKPFKFSAPSTATSLLTLGVCLALGACGGGAGLDESDALDAQDYNRVNNYNYAYVYALGVGAYRRFGEANVLRDLAVRTMLDKAGAPGSYPCMLGGSLRMETAGKRHDFSFNNCDLGNFFVSAGQLSLYINDQQSLPGQAPIEYDVAIRSLSYRADSTKQLMQTLNADIGERYFKKGDKTVDINFSFNVSQGSKKQLYNGGVAKVPGEPAGQPDWVAIHTDIGADGKVNHYKALDVRSQPGEAILTVTGRGDKSSVTGVKLPPNGQSIRLEVRAKGSDTPTLVKTISASDAEELVWRAL